MEKALPWVCGSCAQPRVECDGVAGEFGDGVVWRVEGFAEGVGVGGVVGVFVVVDELSYPLHGVVEHGPSLVWMVC